MPELVNSWVGSCAHTPRPYLSHPGWTGASDSQADFSNLPCFHDSMRFPAISNKEPFHEPSDGDFLRD